jgi:transcription initiation factor TFIIB
MKDLASAGEHSCSECGYVAPHPYVDETSEYRQFALEHGVKNRSRAEFVGEEMYESLSTNVAYDGSARAKKLALTNRRITADPKTVRLQKHVKQIRSLGTQMSFDKTITDRACKLYKEALDAGVMKTKKGEAIDAACLFQACNEKGVRHSMDSFLERLRNVSKRELNSAMEVIKELPSLQNVEERWEGLIPQYAAQLSLPNVVTAAAMALAKNLHEHFEGKKPQSIIAGVLAVVCEVVPDERLKRTVEQISKIVGPKKGTIERHATEIKAFAPMYTEFKEYQDMMGMVPRR